MPHICTRCNNVFDSGEDILKGCPSCGWKKFMYVKDRSREDRAEAAEEQIITQAMGVKRPPRRAGAAGAESSPAIAALGIADYGRSSGSRQGRAAGKGRTGKVSSAGTKEAALVEAAPVKSGPVQAAPAKKVPERASKPANRGDAKALESVKIMGPGTYELNLPSLFERDELIMAVKEGTYFIDLTSAFKKGKKE